MNNSTMTIKKKNHRRPNTDNNKNSVGGQAKV